MPQIRSIIIIYGLGSRSRIPARQKAYIYNSFEAVIVALRKCLFIVAATLTVDHSREAAEP